MTIWSGPLAAEGGEDSPHKKGLEMIFQQFKELLAKAGRQGDRGPGPGL